MANGPVLYGPNFGTEVLAAFPEGIPITWTPYEIEWRERLSASENATLDEVIAAHDPTTPWVKPMTPAEQVMFDHENRLRTIEGQPPLTQDEFVGVLSSGT